MLHITFHVKTLTPLFLTGAGGDTAELRAPSFRGLMRYWHRALVGGMIGANQRTLKQVTEAETEVFGATDTGSTVSIRISHISGMPKEFTESISIRVNGKHQSTGKGYLLWSMAQKRKGLKAFRWFFPPDTTFQITLSVHGNDDAKLKQAIAAFWLLTNLGGVGSRSRRCAGSIAISQPVENNSTSLCFETPDNVEALREKLQNGVIAARNLYSASSSITKENAIFDALSSHTSKVFILQDGKQSWPDAEKAMEDIGKNLQKYRAGIQPLWKRKIFGLPLVNVDMSSRRASPLLLRVTELQNHQYVVIAILFKTMSRGVSIQDYSLIEDWLKTFSGRVEVTL